MLMVYRAVDARHVASQSGSSTECEELRDGMTSRMTSHRLVQVTTAGQLGMVGRKKHVKASHVAIRLAELKLCQSNPHSNSVISFFKSPTLALAGIGSTWPDISARGAVDSLRNDKLTRPESSTHMTAVMVEPVVLMIRCCQLLQQQPRPGQWQCQPKL